MQANLKRSIAADLAADRYDITPEGIYFPRTGALACGEYFGRINGGTWEKHGDNLITTEGFAHLLNVALGGKAKPSGYYLALFSGSADPASNWTAANFAAAANENISQSEGYTAATRPVWTPTDTSTNAIDNITAAAAVTFATTSTVNITGAALLTSAVRGGTTGVLVSASKYAVTRTFQNNDTYEIGYRLTLTV